VDVRARTHLSTCTHAHTHTFSFSFSLFCIFSLSRSLAFSLSRSLDLSFSRSLSLSPPPSLSRSLSPSPALSVLSHAHTHAHTHLRKALKTFKLGIDTFERDTEPDDLSHTERRPHEDTDSRTTTHNSPAIQVLCYFSRWKMKCATATHSRVIRRIPRMLQSKRD